MRNIVQGIAILFSLTLILLIISPIEISFVVSDSMSPTIEPNEDLFFVDKSLDSTENFNEGDVIVYYNPNQDELTTHRVVSIREEGLVTKGDNNLETDQERGTPLVDDEFIFGKAVQFRGSTLTIDEAAPIAKFIDTYNIQVFFGLLILLTINLLYPRDKKSNLRFKRDLTTYKIMFIVTIALLICWTGFIYFSSISVSGSSTIVTEDRDFEQKQFVDRGEKVERIQVLDTQRSIFPTHDEYETVKYGQIQEVERLDSQNEVHIKYTIGPFEEQGVYSPIFIAYPYPKTLPSPIISYLHSIHPLVASLVTLSVIAIPINILLVILTDNVRIRTNRIRISKNIRRFLK